MELITSRYYKNNRLHMQLHSENAYFIVSRPFSSQSLQKTISEIFEEIFLVILIFIL